MPDIYHITTRAEWTAAKEKGSYEAPSLATEGFIHCCELKQMRGVLKRYYEGKKNLVALEINTDLLQSPLRYEKAPSVNEDFPHVYGPINVNAVEEVMSLT
jgi:uncharacterized protein (DUF952 family)